jgi:hypothetical protein
MVVHRDRSLFDLRGHLHRSKHNLDPLHQRRLEVSALPVVPGWLDDVNQQEARAQVRATQVTSRVPTCAMRSIWWYENSNGTFIARLVFSGAPVADSVQVVDVNQDGLNGEPGFTP